MRDALHISPLPRRRWQAFLLAVLGVAALAACGSPDAPPEPQDAAETQTGADALPRTHAPEEGEAHFSTLRMLTDGGENAEAYFSFSGDQLVFQATRPPFECDQIFLMGVDDPEPTLVSTGKGRTTCAYFLPGDERILYSSTHLGGENCPPKPDMSQGYVWALYDSYDIFVTDEPGAKPRRLTDAPGYDAEATVSPRGEKIVFTSVRDGDLDIYTMDLDGSNVQRLTDQLGYDGGPFFSPDGSKIVYRAHHPQTEEEIEDYQALLAEDLIRPGRLEVWVMDADGSNKRQVTDLGVASFAPFFHPSGEKIVFSSNHPDGGREFELFMIDLDGSNLTQITHSPGFDGFPMFSPDGKHFVFASNRHNSEEGETNIFVTRWKD
jgi:Tol biopolymer transport system component